MKITAIVLGLVVLLLSVSPCCAEESCSDEIATEQEAGHNDECGLCSPFLTCGKCVGFTSGTSTLVYVRHFVELNNDPITFSELVKESFYYNFWQPPKIG